MKQAIPGVVPPEADETTVVTVWPSISKYALGRFLGCLYGLRLGFYIFRLGNLIAVVTIPLAILLYLLRIGTRYRVTNRRIVVERGLRPTFERGVELDRFDSIDVVVRPGQDWYDAGDLVFKKGNVETFRLEAVSRPQPFRHTCLKSQRAYVGVRSALSSRASVA
jgi:hypothetical protein